MLRPIITLIRQVEPPRHCASAPLHSPTPVGLALPSDALPFHSPNSSSALRASSTTSSLRSLVLRSATAPSVHTSRCSRRTRLASRHEVMNALAESDEADEWAHEASSTEEREGRGTELLCACIRQGRELTAASQRCDLVHSFQSSPVQSSPVQSSPVQLSPVQSSPTQSTPVQASPVQ
jgi:hypothetical protein